MAGDPSLTRLLLGMGLREFSMQAGQLLLVKQEILRTPLPPLAMVEEVLNARESAALQIALDKLASL
jgi:phosphotransferase system enzyme I (PtsI)